MRWLRNSSMSPGVYSQPFSPECTRCGSAIALAATTGLPALIASSVTIDCSSAMPGMQKMSQRPYASSSSCSLTKPRKCTLSGPRLCAAASFIQVAPAAPSPMTSTRYGTSSGSPATASMSSFTCFSGSSRPTYRITGTSFAGAAAAAAAYTAVSTPQETARPPCRPALRSSMPTALGVGAVSTCAFPYTCLISRNMAFEAPRCSTRGTGSCFMMFSGITWFVATSGMPWRPASFAVARPTYALFWMWITSGFTSATTRATSG